MQTLYRVLLAYCIVSGIVLIALCIFFIYGNDDGNGGRPVDIDVPPDTPLSVPKEWLQEYTCHAN